MVVFMIDADNLSSAAWLEEAFKTLESTVGDVTVRRAYGSAENLRGLSEVMRVKAIRPFLNFPISKNTTDLALAVDAMELACQTPRPAVVVIGSGDADFVPLVVRLRERGIRMICVSEVTKMASEAVAAYDKVFFVGGDQKSVEGQPPVEASPSPAAGIAKQALIKESPAKKASSQVAVAKTVAAKKAPQGPGSAASGRVTVVRVLDAVPSLRSGEFQHLGDVVKLLHDAKLLAKNTASTKLFEKFPHHFELLPAKQPNRVRFILPQ
jgi:hypothetical protein